MLATGRYAGILLKIDTFNEESGTMQTSTQNIYCIGDARYNNVELTPV